MTSYKDIYLRTIWKNIQPLSLPHHCPANSWMVPAAIEKVSSTLPTFSVLNLSQIKFSDSCTHWLFFAVFFGKHFGAFPFA